MHPFNTRTVVMLVNYNPRWGKEENDGKGETHLWLLKSGDEGATWSEPVDITPNVGRIALGPGIGIQMKSGRLVAPVYDGVIFSDDHGRTWKAGGKAANPINEDQVVELADGSLVLNTRGRPNRTVAISKDGGETWGEPWRDPVLTDSELWGGCQASLIRWTRKDEGYDRTACCSPTRQIRSIGSTSRFG
ncbi:MAG: glycoside hydrolase [Verrucomicrobiales bacterium]|nr:glycoside hydrolase [Verrucomicrobiales bacterium]